MTTMKAVSLFSGVGGFDLGFERAGIETVLQAERDPHCLQVLERHWPHTRRVEDVRSVVVCTEPARRAQDKPDRDAADHGRGETGGGLSRDIDLVYGGFPCQDLSVAGKRAGLGGERSGLWFEFWRVLSELRPRWAVVENVPGLLSSNEGRDFGVILDGLDELGFDVGWAILDAQHFGVPQRRRRVFIVAGPSRRAVEQVLAICESCGGHPATGGETGEDIAGTIGDRIARSHTELDGHGAYIPEIVGALSDGAHHGGGLNGQDAYTGRVIATGGVRRLTPLECERLQGFPDGWTEGLADSHRYRQMGNAVCVPVAEWLGHRLVAVDAKGALQ